MNDRYYHEVEKRVCSSNFVKGDFVNAYGNLSLCFERLDDESITCQFRQVPIFLIDCCLWQLGVVVHKFKQILNIFHFFVGVFLFVGVKLGYFPISHLKQDLLGLLLLEHLDWSAQMHSTNFDTLIGQLRLVYHLRSCKASLLIEGIFDELLLEPEILELLLSLTFALESNL